MVNRVSSFGGVLLILLLASGCSLTLELSDCAVDGDCQEGYQCTDDGLCAIEEEEEEEEECTEDNTCEPEEPECETNEECPSVEFVCSEEGACVHVDDVTCSGDEDCGAAFFCVDESCVPPPACDEVGGRVALMWSDFEDPEFTNVEGFREPVGGGVVATDVEEEDSVVLRIDFDVTAEDPLAGYRLFAFPATDVSEYNHVVIRARADRDRPLILRLRDDQVDGADGQSGAHVELTEQWREYTVALASFTEDYEEDRPVNLRALQDITLWVEHDPALPEQGRVEVDHVGLVTLPEDVEGVDFMWSDFDTPEVTNVEGFRNPIDDRTVEEELPGMGLDGSTVLSLAYRTTAVRQTTGYYFFAFPHADVSDQDVFVMRARAPGNVYNLRVRFTDHRHLGEGMEDLGIAYGMVSLGEEWEWVILPLNTLTLAEDMEEGPDFSVLQRISLIFGHAHTCQTSGEVEIDQVGFVSFPEEPEEE